MKNKKLEGKKAYERIMQKKKIQFQRLVDMTSQLNANTKEINKEFEEIIQKKEFDFSRLLTLLDRNIQWFDKTIKALKKDPIKLEYDILQFYLLKREFYITMKELHQHLDFRVRFAIDDKEKIEDLLNQCRLIDETINKLTNSEGNNQKAIGIQIPESLLNATIQSISNRNKELLN